MSSVFRLSIGEPIEASASWKFAEQIADVSDWLNDPANAELARNACLDLGFNSRLSETVAMQGEVIPIKLMQRLVSLNIQLWLSIYPPFAA